MLINQAYFILDEYIIAGEVQDTSKKAILNAIRLQDFIQEEETPQGLFEDAGLGWDNYNIILVPGVPTTTHPPVQYQRSF